MEMEGNGLEVKVIVYVCDCPLCRFFIDTQPSPEFAVTPEDQQKIEQRAHRFSRGTEGNRTIRKKLSIDDLIRPVVS